MTDRNTTAPPADECRRLSGKLGHKARPEDHEWLTELRQDNDMLRWALRALLNNPADAETRRLSFLALGE
jgi:hypothetical protein